MKKRVLITFVGIILGLLLAGSLFTVATASPAAPIDHTLTQPDGTPFTARQWGDEWTNGYETPQGYTILQEASGWWVYADVSADKSLTPAMVGGKSVPANLAAPESIPTHIRAITAKSPTFPSRGSGFQAPNIGSQPTLILLASFSDRANTYTAATFQSLIFGASNSVKDYFLDASFNQLTLTQATESHGTANDGVVGWLNLGYPHPNTGTTTDSRNQSIVKNALIAADPYINYSSYDSNSDGYISINELHLVVVVAGFERAYGNISPSIWAHSWDLNLVTPPTLDGKVLGDSYHGGSYAQFGEIHTDHQATIGIMVHEIGHDITWPDLYDIDGTSEGVGKWSIMGAGNWNYTGSNASGTSPSLPDAWLKWYQGWITPTQVSGTLTGATIPQAETNATAFLLGVNPSGVDWDFYQTSGTGEFFLVENRQLTGYDAGLPGCGLNIWHIDESVTYTNSANANENQPLVKMMEADGLNDLFNGSDRGDTGDPFPGSTSNVTFNYSSNPNSRLYSGADSLASVTGISGCAANMTANLTYSGSVVTIKGYLPLVLTGGVAVQPLVTQNISTVDYNYYASQDFESSLDAYDIYLADDFIVPSSGWNIHKIIITGDTWNGATSLMEASSLTFQVYSDSAGVPSGYPGGGAALWNLVLAPTDTQIAISNGPAATGGVATLTLASPLHLASGHYWLVFYPSLNFMTYGQYGRYTSDTVNGYPAVVINPGGALYPTATFWAPIQATIGTTRYDLAFNILGTP